jgi:DNA-binding XRE family transcriptional regulator
MLAVDADSIRNWEAGQTSIEVRYYPALIEFLGYNPLPLAKTPGAEVRRERMTRGWSRRKLAAVARVDEATITRIEADTKGTARKCWNRVKTALAST